MRVLLTSLSAAALLALAGCPSNSDSARTTIQTVPIVDGAYSGSIACTAGITNNNSANRLFQQKTSGNVDVVLAGSSLTVGGVAIKPGAVVQGAVDSIGVTQTITDVIRESDRITVKYDSQIAFNVSGQQLDFAGSGQYQLLGISDTELLYVEDSVLTITGGPNLDTSLHCEGPLKR